MPSTGQYLAGAKAVGRKQGAAGVKRFFERHGVAFARTEDGRLSYCYDGPDQVAVATSLGMLTMQDRETIRGIAALCERTPVEAT